MVNVAINKVTKTYGAVQVLHDVSIDVQDGEFAVLVGPSGCGKSTLLRMIAGLEDISGGTIEIDGTVVNNLPPKKRDISMVFQNYALYPHMTVAENMGFSLTLAKVKKEEKQRRVAAAAEILALTPLLARYPRQLSGGQRQRVAMGRSIVRDPKVFLFDEPLSNLDAKLRVSMRAEIKSLHQRLGTTIVYVTHDQVEAMTMADKIVVMNDGRIEQIGTPIDLYDNPANVFVATFIGSPAMNIIPGKVSIAGGTKFFRGDDRFEVEVPRSAAVQDGQSVLLGIRPEDFTIGDEGSIDAVIEVVEPMGSQTEVVMLHGNVRIVGSFRQRIAARPTDRIRLTPDIAKASLFDAATQKRIWA